MLAWSRPPPLHSHAHAVSRQGDHHSNTAMLPAVMPGSQARPGNLGPLNDAAVEQPSALAFPCACCQQTGRSMLLVMWMVGTCLAHPGNLGQIDDVGLEQPSAPACLCACCEWAETSTLLIMQVLVPGPRYPGQLDVAGMQPPPASAITCACWQQTDGSRL